MHGNGKDHLGLFFTIRKVSMMNVSNNLGAVKNSLQKIVYNRERFPKCTWFRYFFLEEIS